MHSFRNGNSLPIKLGNWAVLERFFRKRKLNFSKEMIDGTIHCKPGAAEALLQSIYITLTSRGIQVIRDEKVDLTDTAYQKMLPMVARPTATKAVKNNIRITEIMSQQDILTNQQKIQTIIDRHLQHRHEERIEDPTLTQDSAGPNCQTPGTSSATALFHGPLLMDAQAQFSEEEEQHHQPPQQMQMLLSLDSASPLNVSINISGFMDDPNLQWEPVDPAHPTSSTPHH
ncbi:spermatogenesis-associated protein 4 isoform X3 [Rhinatrema bivittatum]|nr:spermatogenesis-associated protein 4 isoform X3 [Rhinatrema bivittatum]